MKHQNKFSQNEEHSHEQQSHAQPAKEFANSDELLRYDAGQTTVPPEIAQRLQESVGDLPGPKQNWLKRLFGGTKP
ncbi:MAG TPA: hypothetical protein VFF11_01120 [Candidatus Binatia bacterium]|nr:hypothetical protein [Candidatus Binatia bacterium]